MSVEFNRIQEFPIFDDMRGSHEYLGIFLPKNMSFDIGGKVEKVLYVFYPKEYIDSSSKAHYMKAIVQQYLHDYSTVLPSFFQDKDFNINVFKMTSNIGKDIKGHNKLFNYDIRMPADKIIESDEILQHAIDYRFQTSSNEIIGQYMGLEPNNFYLIFTVDFTKVIA